MDKGDVRRALLRAFAVEANVPEEWGDLVDGLMRLTEDTNKPKIFSRIKEAVRVKLGKTRVDGMG